MSKVRIGITGLGNIGNVHANNLLENKVPRAEFSAICSSSEEKRQSFADKGLKTYNTTEELIQSGEIDALLIATPHYQHPEIGIQALEAGLHIMVEKPIAAHKADAERLIAAAEKHQDSGVGTKRGTRRYCPSDLGHDRLVPLRSLLPKRRMEGDMERRRRRCTFESMPTPTGCPSVDYGYAEQSTQSCWNRPLSRH
jgi:hypothetical protein